MPESTVLNLDTIEDPKFRLSLNGEEKTYDPFELMEGIKSIVVLPGDPDFETEMDKARAVFGFPLKSENKPTVSSHKMLVIMAEVVKFIETEVEVVKKLLGGTPNSPASTAPAPTPA